jgi:DNA replication protein DnaC
VQVLCDEVTEVLQRLVDENVPALLQRSDALPAVAHESMVHWTRCKHVTEDYFSCQRQMDVLRDYVTATDTDNNRPLVLYGPSGCGKTKLVSKLALEVRRAS